MTSRKDNAEFWTNSLESEKMIHSFMMETLTDGFNFFMEQGDDQGMAMCVRSQLEEKERHEKWMKILPMLISQYTVKTR